MTNTNISVNIFTETFKTFKTPEFYDSKLAGKIRYIYIDEHTRLTNNLLSKDKALFNYTVDYIIEKLIIGAKETPDTDKAIETLNHLKNFTTDIIKALESQAQEILNFTPPQHLQLLQVYTCEDYIIDKCKDLKENILSLKALLTLIGRELNNINTTKKVAS